uniref:Uncharacterized protein n=1 Tax=Corethron hystrix TaxID=216773 RepID=A0A6U5FUH8_9STRA|mmetsp:Transcript_24543/g.56117  ORF Transcript_24543/g.56117 Transcript_24543/m.56117 type:complete len:266 (+) Transcript_24543:243-1040(+)|eukprot:CAMPEP_0113310488 /NCGR_PEP_ID=MMETSP0010_2-20120614/8115_1 /TAXON_ID=216773 ORGANISM="Corethron hystrix, Strain 308" /NCGR_SAMPLE_ID=MMETSP0010_2 /ASSEMBLY_ACC=CAM_ASM_000155 /LENGTH=265 /DNA_ID=CAMNT_0000165957 /DNA_START=395 /DNA_END=1192 /DNA_ORIENTATION=+ /assembly_acc=CAM_ASM_000155
MFQLMNRPPVSSEVEKSPLYDPGNSHHSALRSIYDEMRNRQRVAILEAANCHWSDAYHELQRRISSEFSDVGLLYDADGGGSRGQLHWTAMQLVGFADYDAKVGRDGGGLYSSPRYLGTVRDALASGGMDSVLEIAYVGVICVATGLLMIGVPVGPEGVDVNAARDNLRRRLTDEELPLDEPFVNDIVHSTLYRVVDGEERGGGETKGPLHSRLLDIGREYENTYLGRVTIRNLQVGPASWRMLNDEIKETPPFYKWSLSEPKGN